ncbi:hypothetical protein ACOME3_004006 [Neoechinorhynchus agilis]
MSMLLVFGPIYAIYVAVLFGLHFRINNQISDPYMDEIFHVPQAQAYCVGNYSHWDGNITTPSGLYFYSSAIAFIEKRVFKVCDLGCSSLRFHNVFIGTMIPLIIIKIIKADHLLDFVDSLNIALHPPMFFFYFLYYTDSLSIAFSLLSLLFALRRRPWVSALLIGYASLQVRQTNIVFVPLIGWITLRECIQVNREFARLPLGVLSEILDCLEF